MCMRTEDTLTGAYDRQREEGTAMTRAVQEDGAFPLAGRLTHPTETHDSTSRMADYRQSQNATR